jgi:hypothetical protein
VRSRWRASSRRSRPQSFADTNTPAGFGPRAFRFERGGIARLRS